MAVAPIRIPGVSTTPNGVNLPGMQPIQNGAGIGAALARVGGGLADIGQAVQHVDEVDLQVAKLHAMQDEDDAKVYVSQKAAEAGLTYQKAQEDAFNAAPDGWRGATGAVESAMNTFYAEALKQAPSPTAEKFLAQSQSREMPQYLTKSIAQEQAVRRAWRSDTIQKSVDQVGSVLAADPSGWASSTGTQTAAIDALSDISELDRQKLKDYALSNLSIAAMTGLIQQNPASAKRQLQDPGSTGPAAYLKGQERAALINRADAEISSRESKWKSNIGERMAMQFSAMQSDGDIPIPHPVTVEEVRAAKGPEAADQWEQVLAQHQAGLGSRFASTTDLIHAANTPPPQAADETGVKAYRVWKAQSGAARKELIQRRDDPMAAMIQKGIAPALDFRDPNALAQGLMQRAAAASANATRFGYDPDTAYNPLTKDEADQVAGVVRRLPPDQQALLFARASKALESTPEVGDAFLRQIAPGDPTLALAGKMAFQGRQVAVPKQGGSYNVTGQQAAALALEGHALLFPAEKDKIDGAGKLKLPDDRVFNDRWRTYVGDAYTRPNQGALEEAVKASAKAIYATLSKRAGTMDQKSLNTDAYDAAMALATGGVAEINGQKTAMPWGMGQDAFQKSLQDGWPTIKKFYGLTGDPKHYTYLPYKGDRYIITEGRSAAKTTNGQLPIVQLNTGQLPQATGRNPAPASTKTVANPLQ